MPKSSSCPNRALSSWVPFVSSTSGPLLTPPTCLVTPDQLAQTRPHVLPPTQINYHDLKDVGPGSADSTMQFTEEFDFEAMNEKFIIDEVWVTSKDDFFDTISCNSLTRRARNVQKGRISEALITGAGYMAMVEGPGPPRKHPFLKLYGSSIIQYPMKCKASGN
ncbi:hypothetical protein SLEP1_g21854 [Rubroshorea leprosula]|uniref:DFDF domain-containing protein n=1 Tax=Rubroshorea leprosula TaxID=152421 RepID=A0AAV5JEQ7_9ROSI|nr:hypothetical protein SLEP1_g21854 [Rubroshorea leprosula]